MDGPNRELYTLFALIYFNNLYPHKGFGKLIKRFE